MKRPVVEGEIVGRRGWRIGPASKLHSSWAQRGWLCGANEAHCAHGRPHQAPNRHCECGLYAVYEPDEVHRFTGTHEVLGLVTAWGDVELHSNGFRAQFARVAAIVNLPGAADIAARYGVPLMTYAQWKDDAFIAEFGEIVPRELRPTPRRESVRSLQPGARLPARRKWGLRSHYAAIGIGAITCAFAHSAWPIVGSSIWVAVVTITVMFWPDWWDA